MKNQVGGHEGITTSEDNTMIIKPTNSFEQDFYNQIPHYPNILPFIPRYYGSLSATTEGEGEKLGFQGEGILSPNNPAQTKDIMICIQNVSAYFNKPSILDLKMGTRLYDENNVTEEKKLRMIAKARATTSHSSGIRVTGMKVYDHLKDEYVEYDRNYGLSLSVSALKEAFINYLPLSIPDQLRSKLIDLFLEELKDLEPIIKSIPMRMYGSSILFVYEGDLIRLEKLLNGKNVLADKIELEEKEEAQEEEDEDEEEEDEEEDYLKYSPAALKLIDFAHTTFHDGKPDDEGYWLGLENTIKHFEDMKNSSESN